MNLPNILTVSRIIMVMLFVALATLVDLHYAPLAWEFPLRLFGYLFAILAGLTDLVDGHLARKWHQVTDFGALMDPLADKIFVTAMMLMAIECHLLPAWIAIAVLFREFMVTGLRTLGAKQQIVISADRWGKLKTASQMVMLAIAGASWVWSFDLHTERWFGVRLWYVWFAYLCAVVLITLLSGFGYFIRYRFLVFGDRKKA